MSGVPCMQNGQEGGEMRRQRQVLVLISAIAMIVGVGMRLALRPSVADQERAAQEALRHGNLDVAAGLAREALGRSAEAQRAREVLHRVARMQGNTALMISLYRDVPLESEGAARAWFEAGEVAFHAALARLAHESWTKSLVLDPGNIPAYDRLIALAGIRQDTEEVFRLLELRSQHAPHTSQSIRLMLGAESLGSDSAGWQQTLLNFVEADAADVDSMVGLARRWIELGRPDKAAGLLSNVTLSREGLIVRAHALALQGDVDVAAISLGDLAGISESGEFHFVEGLIASIARQYEAAEASLARAVEQRPLSRPIRALYCEVLRDLGHEERNAVESALLVPLQEIEEIAKNPGQPLDAATVDLLIRHCESVRADDVVRALAEFRASLEGETPSG